MVIVHNYQNKKGGLGNEEVWRGEGQNKPIKLN